MTATVAGIHLGIDVHASRPAANTVPDGSIFSCSTHGLIYKSNFAGNSWATWATLAGASAAFHGVRAKQTADTALTSGSVVYVAFDAADEYDTDAYHNPASNNSRLVVPSGLGGYYHISAGAFSTASPGASYCVIRKNGTTIMANGVYSTDASIGAFLASCTLLLAATDYVEFGIKVGAAGKSAIDAGVVDPFLEMYLIGT